MRRLALLPLLALAACGTDFAPASQVQGFRVLGLRAEPPDLHPGDSTTLDALVVNPSDPSQPTSGQCHVVHPACIAGRI